MSLYCFAFLIILIFAFCDIWAKRIRLRIRDSKINIRLVITLLILFVMLAFRYGQGTDYFGYEKWYKVATKSSLSDLYINKNAYHVEFGWLLINHFFGYMGYSFQEFIVLLSLIEIILIDRFICKYSEDKECFALLLLFPTFIFTYGFSALRQGLVMCIWAGYLLPCLQNNKLIRYVIGTIICASFHIVALFYLLFLIAKYFCVRKRNYLYLFCLMSVFFGTVIGGTELIAKIYSILPANVAGRFEIRFSYEANLLRIVMLVIIHFISRKINNDPFYSILYNMYLIGCCLFFVFSGFTLFANRLFALFGICIEIVFICKFINLRIVRNELLNIRFPTTRLVLMLFTISTIMFAKNLYALASTTKYSILTYPYTSVLQINEYDYIFENN